ncbi:hypothetical protein [Streptomyces sp. NPDC048172]|uniref:hypothetical protein n=1 Tax=Streptomyces sp. NPDC048172 TaxID=3365505 RepID=UPI00371F4A74
MKSWRSRVATAVAVGAAATALIPATAGSASADAVPAFRPIDSGIPGKQYCEGQGHAAVSQDRYPWSEYECVMQPDGTYTLFVR